MNRTITPLLAAALLYSTGASAALQNGNFAEFTAPADGTTTGYDFQQGPPGWFLTATVDGATLVYAPDDAAEGIGGYFEINAMTDGYGANKLEQCVPINDTDTLQISFAVFATSLTEDATGMAVRVNPNFYANIEDCLEAQFSDSGGARLSDGGARPNANVNFVLGADDGQRWIDRTPDAEPDLTYTAADIPDGARYMNLSLRARDRQGATPPTLLRFDNVRVTQGTSSNRVINGHFDHVELFDGAAISGVDGWIVDRDGDPLLKAAVGPLPFALSGNNAFSFETLTGNFGLNKLDQCFALEGADIRPTLFAYSLRPDPGLQVRVNVDFFTDAACTTAAAGDPRIRQDFPLDGDAGEWLALVANEVRGPGDYGDATHASLSIRARDRSNLAGDGPGEYVRVVYLDDVSVAAGVATPTFSPAPGEFVDSVTVTLSSATDGAVIYYTLDGTEPDDGAANVSSGGTVTITQTTTLTVRAFAENTFSGTRSGTYTIVAPPAPPPPPPRQLSTGCSISGQPTPFDPTLWLLVAGALGGIAWRRRRTAAGHP